MANRIVQNVLIIDSAMGNNLILTSANLVVNMSNLTVNAIGFISLDTTGVIAISGVNTSNFLFRTAWTVQGTGASTQPSMQWFPFDKAMKWENLKVPVLTAGTGFLYLA